MWPKSLILDIDRSQDAWPECNMRDCYIVNPWPPRETKWEEPKRENGVRDPTVGGRPSLMSGSGVALNLIWRFNNTFFDMTTVWLFKTRKTVTEFGRQNVVHCLPRRRTPTTAAKTLSKLLLVEAHMSAKLQLDRPSRWPVGGQDCFFELALFSTCNSNYWWTHSKKWVTAYTF